MHVECVFPWRGGCFKCSMFQLVHVLSPLVIPISMILYVQTSNPSHVLFKNVVVVTRILVRFTYAVVSFAFASNVHERNVSLNANCLSSVKCNVYTADLVHFACTCTMKSHFRLPVAAYVTRRVTSRRTHHPVPQAIIAHVRRCRAGASQVRVAAHLAPPSLPPSVC